MSTGMDTAAVERTETATTEFLRRLDVLHDRFESIASRLNTITEIHFGQKPPDPPNEKGGAVEAVDPGQAQRLRNRILRLEGVYDTIENLTCQIEGI